MTFDVEVAGRSRRVSIEPAAGADRYRVTVDGRSREVSARRSSDFGLLLSESATAGFHAAPREMFVSPVGPAGELLVTLEGRTAVVILNGRRASRKTDASVAAHGEQPVVAPMPGRVVRVLVAPGDAVAARQGVVVVEAMKMENELRAPKEGRVKDVSVTAGASVEAGRVLVVIE